MTDPDEAVLAKFRAMGSPDPSWAAGYSAGFTDGVSHVTVATPATPEPPSYDGPITDNEYAEHFHKSQCRHNHCDQCGWMYESWDDPGYSRRRWRDRALAVERDSRVPRDQILRVLHAMGENR